MHIRWQNLQKHKSASPKYVTGFDLLHTSGTDEDQNYIWGKGVVSASNGAVSFYYMNDQLGSPIRLLGRGRSTKASYAYDEFGNLEKDEAIELLNMGAWNPFGFTGYQPDRITGMDFAQARFYNPSTSRMLSEDIERGSIRHPYSLNAYSYCFNNPLAYVDLNGHWPSLADVESVASNIAEGIESAAKSTANGIESAARNAANGIESAAKNAAKGIESAANDIGNKLLDVIEKVGRLQAKVFQQQ